MPEARGLSGFTIDLSQPSKPTGLPRLADKFRPFLEAGPGLPVVPDVSGLLPGDIILKVSPGSPVSAFQLECGPPKLPREAYEVSHVAIYASHGNVIESTPYALTVPFASLGLGVDGVRISSLLGMDYAGTRIAARRMPGLSRNQREAVRAAAERHVGRRYDVRDITHFAWVFARRRFRRLIRRDQALSAPPFPVLEGSAAFDSVICSELIEEAYAKILGRRCIKIPTTEQTFAQPLPCNYYRHPNLEPVPLGLCRV